MLDSKKRVDKAFGALVGLAIGDSFGDASRTETNHLRFGITMDFADEASWSTDDTEFALLTAQALIDCGGDFTSEAVVAAWEKYILFQEEFKRGGSSEIEAALNLKRGLKPPYTGMYNAYHISDGAAMRVAPIGIVCAGDISKAAQWAQIDAELSHYRDGIWGAQAVAAGVACAMVDGSVDEVIAAALSVIPKDSWLYYTFAKAMNIVDEHKTLEDAWTPLHTELWTTYKAAVPEAVSQAFALFRLSGGDFRRGVIYSGNFGRDADTIGAIVGSLLGAQCGVKGIPARWMEKTRYPTGTCLQFTKGKDLQIVAQELAALMK
ncbi:MAG TPA: ADP-ribosylglycohydrolase family protein [Limnochordia bacterium]|nr:ADP-ribosylglycohydrolase family protein [Limnochordia bacterium]